MSSNVKKIFYAGLAPDAPPPWLTATGFFGFLGLLSYVWRCQHGEFNFLLSNGDCLFAHASTQLHYIVRRAPFTQAHMQDQDITVDFSALTTSNDRVAIIATTTLTDNEAWIGMPAGSLWWFEDGAAIDTLETRPDPLKKAIA